MSPLPSCALLALFRFLRRQEPLQRKIDVPFVRPCPNRTDCDFRSTRFLLCKFRSDSALSNRGSGKGEIQMDISILYRGFNWHAPSRRFRRAELQEHWWFDPALEGNCAFYPYCAWFAFPQFDRVWSVLLYLNSIARTRDHESKNECCGDAHHFSSQRNRKPVAALQDQI